MDENGKNELIEEDEIEAGMSKEELETLLELQDVLKDAVHLRLKAIGLVGRRRPWLSESARAALRNLFGKDLDWWLSRDNATGEAATSYTWELKKIGERRERILEAMR
jgi:hypothetical protein